MPATDKHIVVLGGGAWGTALANLMANNGHQTTLWCRDADCAAQINTAHENTAYLSGIALNPALKATSNAPDFAQADLILSVIPAQVTGAVLSTFADNIPAGTPLLLCSKGIERASLSFMADVVKTAVPHAVPFVLSGPSFAKDVAIGLPTAVTLAGPSIAAADAIAPIIAGGTFRPYTSDDIIGAEIGGAVKNVLAIACGIVLGLELGQSAHAALIARGFAEMRRLGDALGAKPETLSGLSGLGDLVLTCSSTQSRNMSCGLALGQGQTMAQIMAGRNAVTEGVATAPALSKLAKNLGVEMPICQTVADIVADRIAPDAAVTRLLSRPLKGESELGAS